MGAGHSHGATGSAAGRHKGRLAWALGLTLAYMGAEVAGGLLTGSLALLADAAHMLTDAGGLALALLAIRGCAIRRMLDSRLAEETGNTVTRQRPWAGWRPCPAAA